MAELFSMIRGIRFCPERKGERRKTRGRGRGGRGQLEDGQAGPALFPCPPHVCSLLHASPHASLTPPGSSASASHWVRPMGNPDRKSESGRRVFTLLTPFLFLPQIPGALGEAPALWLCCRKGDPFQGPKLGSCLTLGNELSEETHVLTKQEILLGKGAQAESRKVRAPRRTSLSHGLQSWVLW